MNKKILIIGAVWCPSCLIVNQHLKKIQKKYDICIENLDYDFDEEKVKQYDVGTKLPTIILKDEKNKEIKRLSGEKTYSEILEWLGEK